MEIFTATPPSIENVVAVEIFVRDSPPCHFCIQAKNWIRKNLPHADVTEYSISKHHNKWSIFASTNPRARAVPQITLTMKNGERKYIGGFFELEKAFQ